MGAHGNRRTTPPPPLSALSLSPSPMLHHINPLAAEPLQTEAQVRAPATSHKNADTSITPQGGKKKNMLNLMRRTVPCEEETFIHLFCLFSKTNRGRYYAATLITLLSFTVKFQIRGFGLLTFIVISKPCCFLPSHPSSKMRLLGLLHKLQIGGNEIIPWSPELNHLRVVLTCGTSTRR